MKKILLLALLLPAFAKSQCLVQKDKFTGKELKAGSVYLNGGVLAPQMPVVMIGKQDQALMFVFMMQAPVTASSFDKEKMICLIRFKDGSFKKLKSSINSVITTMSNQSTTVAFYSDLTADDLLIFKNNPVETIRFSYNGDENYGYDTEIKPNKAKQIMKSVDCVI